MRFGFKNLIGSIELLKVFRGELKINKNWT